jgi:RNA polymerase sigma-70 factor (ECF subfamily)
MEGLHSAADDPTLVRAVAAGSEDALAALYDRHASAVYAAASRLTTDRQVAEEVVQETFLALWNKADSFDPATGSLPAWLYTIARNRTVDRLRSIGRRPKLVSPISARNAEEPESFALDRLASIGVVVGGAARDGGPEGALAAAELRSTLRDALASMPDTEKAVIVLAYRDDLSQSEIAERLGWPLGTVKTRTRRALFRLRELVADRLGPEYAPTPIPVEVGE